MSDEQMVTQYYTNGMVAMSDEDKKCYVSDAIFELFSLEVVDEGDWGDETIDELRSRLPPLQGWPADREFSTNMTDENDVRQVDRAEEQAVVKRVSDVVSDLSAGKVGSADRHNLGDALERANRNAGVQRAIR